jgi:DNA-binding response OmpR family regulator
MARSVQNYWLKKSALMNQPPSHRILLAEEQAVSRDLLVLVLGKLGYPIETVTTPRDVLQRLRSSRFSLILLSTTLAGAVSAKFLRRISTGPNGSVPVAMIGAPTDRDSGEAWLECGAIDYLSRPIDIERLLRVVEQVMRGQAGTPSGQDAQPVIDLVHLSGFTDGDRQLEDELLTLFLSSADVYLTRMREALRTGQSWKPVAHALKGASANLGARRVMELALAAERSPPSAAQLEALRASVEEVRGFERARSR